jgi:hypothetical protein
MVRSYQAVGAIVNQQPGPPNSIAFLMILSM